MYKYMLINKEEETMVFSNKHYTTAGFKKLVKQVVKDLREDGFELLPKNKVEMIKRELINNHDFISCTDNKINCDVTEL